MTPFNIASWVEHLTNNGYENVDRCGGGSRDNYVKYEETNEGYCQKLKEN